jgi:pentatricopeptide repeat protein
MAPCSVDRCRPFFARRFEYARALLLRSLQENPSWVPTYRFLASCYAHLGRLDEARELVERLRRITPVVVPSATHWRDPEQRELYLSGLRPGEPAPPPSRSRHRARSILLASFFEIRSVQLPKLGTDPAQIVFRI